jgi:hypothetical protein
MTFSSCRQPVDPPVGLLPEDWPTLPADLQPSQSPSGRRPLLLAAAVNSGSCQCPEATAAPLIEDAHGAAAVKQHSNGNWAAALGSTQQHWATSYLVCFCCCRVGWVQEHHQTAGRAAQQAHGVHGVPGQEGGRGAGGDGEQGVHQVPEHTYIYT